MWVVQIALRRPNTFVVLSFLIAIFGVLAAIRTPTDIFPNIDIPVVSVVWTYNGLAQITPGPSPGIVSHYNVQPVIDICGAVQGRDLGAVSSDIDRILRETSENLPRGSYVSVRGQVHTMTSAYSQLYFGLAGAVVLVYLVIVVNFQSWLDPFILRYLARSSESSGFWL